MKQLFVMAAALALSGCAKASCTPSACTRTDLGGGLFCQACEVESPTDVCFKVTCICIPLPPPNGCDCQEDGTYATPVVPSPCQGPNY